MSTRSDWIGRTIGRRYEIQDLLGQGGMSAVYKAYDPNLRRVVAVKIIHPHLSQDTQFIHRFEEEAASVAQLRHPNIIQVYDFNHDDDVYFIVFEFIAGETAQSRLKRMKAANMTMDVDEATKIAQQVAEGLQNAHSKGLIHRDIKPANIMLNVSGSPIIMDFGIAKIMGGTQHTATGAVLGTARYMSPEQIQGHVIDPRTDIYSLGVTLFEMLGGRPPFEANSAMTLMMMHMTDPVPDLNAIRSEVSPQLVAIVNKSLAKNPADRYPSAAAMAAALGNIGKGSAVAGATMVEGFTTKQDSDKTVVESPAPEIRPGAVAVGAGAVAVGAAGAVAAERATTAPSVPQGAVPPVKTGGSRMPLYIGGAVILLLLIAGGVWAAFFRDGGSGGAGSPTEIPAVVVEPTDTPDTAATDEAVAARATADEGTRAAQEETRAAEESAPTDTAEPTEEPTSQPSPEAEDTAEPTPALEPTVESVAAIDQVEGEVMIITPGGQEMPLTADTPITEGTEIITGQDGELALTLDDDSTIQLLEDGQIRLDSLGSAAANELQQTAFTLFAGDMLLQVPPGSSEQAVFSDAGLLLATVANADTAADLGRSHALGKRTEQNDNNAAMSVSLEGNRVFISCFSGVCSTYGGNDLNAGWEKAITVDGSFISLFPITNQSTSYQVWQENCQGCLPQAPPPPTPTFTPVPPTDTPTPGGTVTATPTAAGTPTATTEATPTAAGEATSEATAEATTEASPTPAQPSYSARITNIALQDGRYIVDFTTSGYTPSLPGRHVHFFFDTVSTANAGVPGSGPWKLYGGPSPFTEYSEADKYFDPSAMCILVANEDHSIIPGTGNCFPLP